MVKVFIDGSAGTTGLVVEERLKSRGGIELLSIPENLRKDAAAKAEVFASADLVFLCLPDAAAKEAAALVPGNTTIIDTSTAHRTDDVWVYGFPELPGQREKISASKRIANPGCHASGFIALVAPLVRAGLISNDAQLSSFSVTGYSGGGKKMIADYEDGGRSELLDSPMQYALTQEHKHIPEMMKVCGLSSAPVFCPVVGDFYSGMTVTVQLFKSQISGTVSDIEDIYSSTYKSGVVHFEKSDESGIYAGSHSGLDDMAVTVKGNDERILLISSFDNLGKGACGAAIQNMNLALGLDETEGLIL
ncbi:MAG: N-acetyl-gamma-glutamyl-phosphate reductase [Clostridia bacterium]|nr:N-acetyl-gamma-glutamyl-phosphate reductase [Clostridia bacterium]